MAIREAAKPLSAGLNARYHRFQFAGICKSFVTKGIFY
jgi:hypothetical protein